MVTGDPSESESTSSVPSAVSLVEGFVIFYIRSAVVETLIVFDVSPAAKLTVVLIAV